MLTRLQLKRKDTSPWKKSDRVSPITKEIHDMQLNKVTKYEPTQIKSSQSIASKYQHTAQTTRSNEHYRLYTDPTNNKWSNPTKNYKKDFKGSDIWLRTCSEWIKFSSHDSHMLMQLSIWNLKTTKLQTWLQRTLKAASTRRDSKQA
jgi:hypothetical protein